MNRRRALLLVLFVSLCVGLLPSWPLAAGEPPALVVVVSVDQLAYEYLQRFAVNFQPGGVFRRAQRQGLWYANCQHRHAYTVTAAGHAVMLTGCYASEHGIVGNAWFDRRLGRSVYCVTDTQEQLVGGQGGTAASPRTLLVETAGDQLKRVTGGRAKVFGVAIKDRAAVLMAGHRADAAIWLSGSRWVTSTYYRKRPLPWLDRHNQQQSWKKYAGKSWTLLLPREKYLHGPKEDSFGERPGAGLGKDFPHRFDKTPGPQLLRQLGLSPVGNDLTLEVARLLVVEEELGQDDVPDLLCINLSSNDYVGHAFGPGSLEVEDMTYRTDLQLGRFAEFLDQALEGRRWAMFISADHGVAPIPERAVRDGLPAARNSLGTYRGGRLVELQAALEQHLRNRLQGVEKDTPALIQVVTPGHVYLVEDHPLWKNGLDRVARRLVRDWLLRHEAVAAAATRDELLSGDSDTPMLRLLANAYHPRRSGDVLFVLKPYHILGGSAATHGSPWHYDRHVPLVVVFSRGWKVKPRRVMRPVSPAAIGPTVSHLCRVPEPSAAREPVLRELWQQP